MFAAAAAANSTMDPATSEDPAVLNYEAQFLHNDYRQHPEGGFKRRSNSASVLRAVEWQRRQVAEATMLSSWDSRLNLHGDEGPRALTKQQSFVGDAYAAARIRQKQAMADLRTRKSSHSLTGTQMQAESFDNVYSEAHASKDTASALGNGNGDQPFMVPTVDPRGAIVRPKDIPHGEEPMILTAKGKKPLLPSRSVMAIECGVGLERPGPGRSIDY